MNLKYKKLYYSILLIALSIGIIGCSHNPPVQEYPDTASASVEVKNLETDMNNAIAKQANVFSPNHFEKAESDLKSAQKSLSKGEPSRETLHEVARSRAHLGEALRVTESAHDHMEAVMEARNLALQNGALAAFPADFKNADQELTKNTEELEHNDLKGITKNREKLQASYLDLELKAIKNNALGESKVIVDLARKEGAQTYAPRTLAIAEKAITDSDAYLTTHRHEQNKESNLSAFARSSADHVLKITRESKLNNKVSSEETAIQLETEKDLSDHRLGQLKDSENSLNSKQKELNNEQSNSSLLGTQNQTLGVENRSLESKRRYQEKFNAAQAEFSEGEAQVYQQGSQLVIRLRSLDFTPGLSAIPDNSHSLLSKVQKVIQDMDSKEVTVEGHTDSSGGKRLNQKLSTARAEAVKEYLDMNSTSREVNVQSIGYGYQKPIATNKTAAGRAENRRVDILIQTEAPGKL